MNGWLTTTQVAEMKHVSLATINRYIKSGKIQAEWDIPFKRWKIREEEAEKEILDIRKTASFRESQRATHQRYWNRMTSDKKEEWKRKTRAARWENRPTP